MSSATQSQSLEKQAYLQKKGKGIFIYRTAHSLMLDGKDSVFEVNMLPCKCKAFADTQTAIPANHKRQIESGTGRKAIYNAAKKQGFSKRIRG